MSTGIEWTDETWNPVVGCSAISPGCDRCYASAVASREMQPAHRGLTDGRQWNGTVRVLPDRLAQPIKWTQPRRIFVGSMTDLFHEQVADDYLARIWATMAACGRHTFQVLTKRSQRMGRMLSSRWSNDGLGSFESRAEHWVGNLDGDLSVTWPLLNVWLGTSIENDRYTFRADHLRATPASVRFLSLEPLLGPLPSLDLDGIDWVIVGAESGPGARPMDDGWVREIRDRCVDAGVALFYKQKLVDGRKVGTPELDGRTWTQFPEAVHA